MESEINELRKIKGVGEVLSRRLVEAGFHTFAKIVDAGEDGLKKIRGVHPGLAADIICQAAALAGERDDEIPQSTAEKIGELKQRVVHLRRQVQGVALDVRERLVDQGGGKNGKKVGRELVKMITTLEMVESTLDTRTKKAGRGLTEAEKRLTGLTGAGCKRVDRGLKKARKSLEKVYA